MNKSRSQCMAKVEAVELEPAIGRCEGIAIKRPPISFQRSSRRRNLDGRFASAAGGFRESLKGWGECRPATAETTGEAIRNLSDQERQTGRLCARGSSAEAYRAAPGASALRLSTTPLSDPAGILRRMPTQAISPAPLALLDIMSGPILLIEDSPAGELREIAPVRPALAEAA